MKKNLYGDINALQSIFQTLSDENRLKIIKYINTEERSVSQIVEETRLSQPLVSHHLKSLRDRNILGTTRNGPFIYYYLKDIGLLHIFDEILAIADSIQKI